MGRPVKLSLTRPQMFTGMGHREDQTQTLRLGATRDGKLTALIHEKTSTTSPWDNYAESNSKIINNNLIVRLASYRHVLLVQNIFLQHHTIHA